MKIEMAKIKYFERLKISVYIYGEANGRHHEKHVLVLKRDEACQYGFDGEPIGNSKALKNKADRIAVSEWIKSNRDKLEQAWLDINEGKNPGMIGWEVSYMTRAAEVKAMDNYLLLIKFDNGELRVFNCFPLLENKLFSELKNIDFFKTVHIDEMGLVCWNNATDINPYDLYDNSESLADFKFAG